MDPYADIDLALDAAMAVLERADEPDAGDAAGYDHIRRQLGAVLSAYGDLCSDHSGNWDEAREVLTTMITRDAP